MASDEGNHYAREFGRHVRSLRRARALTQELLAERSGLSADTVRRLERGMFSASIETLRKLCCGMDVAMSTLFEGFELGRSNQRRELFDLVATRSDEEIVLVIEVVRALLLELDKLAASTRATRRAEQSPLE